MRLVPSDRLVVTAPLKPKRTNRGAWRDRPIGVPPWLLEHRREVNYKAMLLYGLLEHYETKQRTVTHRELGQRFGVSGRTVQRWLEELMALTLVRKERTGRGNRYVRTDHVWEYAL